MQEIVTIYVINCSTAPITSADPFPSDSDCKSLDDKNTVGCQLQSNVSDIGMGFLYFYTSRTRLANPLLPSSDEIFKLYFLQPKLQNLITPFSEQFKLDVFLSFLGLLLLTAIVLAHVQRNIEKQQEANRYLSHSRYRYLCDTLIWAVGTWCQQGPVLKATKWQVIHIATVINYLCIFLYYIYCAVVLSTLTRELIRLKVLMI